jgi:hypothetical protein
MKEFSPSSSNMDDFVEYEFKLDEFNLNSKATGQKAISFKIMQLLMLPPSSHPENPNLGFNIKKYIHEFASSINLTNLAIEIKKQSADYVNSNEIQLIETRWITPTGVDANSSSDRKALIVLIQFNNNAVTALAIKSKEKKLVFSYTFY